MVTDNYDNAFVFYTLCSYNSVLINHVHTTHTTHKNHSIVEMVERISVYSDSLNQSNASEYFMRNNAKHYDPNTGSYKNVSLSNAIAKSYEGNVMEVLCTRGVDGSLGL